VRRQIMLGSDSESSPSTATDGRQDAFVSAYITFHSALGAAWPSPDAERSVGDAYATYAAVLQEAWQSPDVARRAAEAYANYARRVHEAFAGDETRQRVLEAYRRYGEDLKRAWAALDATVIAPEELVAIVQSIGWVATVVGEISRAPSRMV
jgi:hypothetical protein